MAETPGGRLTLYNHVSDLMEVSLKYDLNDSEVRFSIYISSSQRDPETV